MPMVDWNVVVSVAWGVFVGGLLAASLAVPVYGTLARAGDGIEIFVGVFIALVSFLGTVAFLGVCYALWEYVIPWSVALVGGALA